MTGFSALSSLLVNLPLLVALGAAVAVCLVLVTRRQDLVSGLALGGFSGLFLTYALTSFTPSVSLWLAHSRPARNAPLIMGAFTLAESTVAALAVGCLIGAVWLGLHRRSES
jgi:hypothetical protein